MNTGKRLWKSATLYQPSLRISTSPTQGGAVAELSSSEPAVRADLLPMFEVQAE